jgi:hypothetical protein
MCNLISMYKKKKITLHFETNDEHQARSYQNSLRDNVINYPNYVNFYFYVYFFNRPVFLFQ